MRAAHRVRDTWVGDSPDRAELGELLADDPGAREVLLDRPIADVVEEHVGDERLRALLHGQGVIGTWAGPRDPGTAGMHAMHAMGTLADGRWGYVRGGTGRVSFALADAAVEHGAVLAAGVAVGAIEPGIGVRLAGGELVRASVVVSNADPKRSTALCAADVPQPWRARVADWRSSSPVLKINCALRRLPRFTAAPDSDLPHRAMVTITSGIDATQAAFERARLGQPAPSWAEVYFPSAYDPSVAPDGKHVMSVFAQYVPYQLAEGSWDGRRTEIAEAALAEVARFAPDVADCIAEWEVLGATRRRGPDRAHRRPHLPGRLPPGPDVGPALRAADADPGPVPVRRGHPSRRQRDRGERSQRGAGGARGHRPERVPDTGVPVTLGHSFRRGRGSCDTNE